MTQADLCFDAPCRVPENKDGQLYELLMALERGERLTVQVALMKYGCYALSQRMGELRREYGWPIKSRPLTIRPGTTVSEYWL